MTDGAQDVLKAIGDYFSVYGYMPTMRELCALTGLSSTSSVNYYMEELYDTGEIESDHRGSPRAYRIT